MLGRAHAPGMLEALIIVSTVSIVFVACCMLFPRSVKAKRDRHHKFASASCIIDRNTSTASLTKLGKFMFKTRFVVLGAREREPSICKGSKEF